MGKAREWWLLEVEDDIEEIMLPVAYPKQTNEPGEIHVIEMSAYLELQQQLARAEEVLRFYADKNNWLRYLGGWRHDMIEKDLDDETLTDWEGRFSGKRAREYFKAKG